MKKSKSIILLVSQFIIIIILFVVIYLILQMSFGKSAKFTITNKLKVNEKLFEEIYNELYELNENSIYFKKDGSSISVSIHEQINEKINVIKVKEEEFYKYEKTIKNMKKLKLTKIKKEDGNIIVPIKNSGQYIVKMFDEEKFKRGYNVTYIEQIRSNWYYIETKT